MRTAWISSARWGVFSLQSGGARSNQPQASVGTPPGSSFAAVVVAVSSRVSVALAIVGGDVMLSFSARRSTSNRRSKRSLRASIADVVIRRTALVAEPLEGRLLLAITWPSITSCTHIVASASSQAATPTPTLAFGDLDGDDDIDMATTATTPSSAITATTTSRPAAIPWKASSISPQAATARSPTTP